MRVDVAIHRIASGIAAAWLVHSLGELRANAEIEYVRRH